MKNKKLKLSLATLTVSGLSLTAFGYVSAENYLYVDTSGNLQMEVADTPMEALNQAPNIAPHSGVIDAEVFGETLFPPVFGTTNVNTEPITVEAGQELYTYVDVFGNMQTIIASSPQDAINRAENIDPDSGVILVIE